VPEAEAPDGEAVTEPDAEASVFEVELAVDPEVLIPVFAEVFVFRVLLQFASIMAKGNTKNAFFITWSFYIRTVMKMMPKSLNL
jgi:hypothetical protein